VYSTLLNFELMPARPQGGVGCPPFHQWLLPDGELWLQFYRTESGYLLRFPGLADYLVSREAHMVNCHPALDVPEATSQHLYLNQVLPLALSKMGNLVFHASAVELDGRAIAFVGESGRGKSTLAISLALEGYAYITDDGLVLRVEEASYMAYPSHLSFRLSQDSWEALIPAGDSSRFPVDADAEEQFFVEKNIAFCRQPRPLQRVYFLGDGSSSSVTIEPMKPTEARIEWIRHSFLLDSKDKTLLAEQFEQMSKHAHSPIYYRLDYPRRYRLLPEVREVIIQHALKG
jgi:hypothetical protein